MSDVVAIGHSEGALIAGSLATDTDIDGAVLLATTTRTGEEALRWQAQNLASDIPPWVASMLRLFRTSISKQQDRRLSRIKTSTSDTIRMQLVARVNAKWFRELLAYDPIPTLKSSRVPLLAITGSKDVQVDPAGLETAAAVAAAPITARVVPDVDHLMRYEPAPTSSPRRYRAQLTKPIDSRVVGAAGDWLTTTYGIRRPEDPDTGE